MANNYELVASYSKANIRQNAYYAKDNAAKTALLANESLLFGDSVKVLSTGVEYVWDGTALVELPNGSRTYVAGEGISINENGAISVTSCNGLTFEVRNDAPTLQVLNRVYFILGQPPAGQ